VPIELSDLLATARVVSIPLRQKFRGLTEREALLFEGPQGWAEWSPFTEYPIAEAAVWLQAAIEAAFAPPQEFFRTKIGINATLPAVSEAEVPLALAPFGAFGTVKIKVGGTDTSAEADLARIEAVVSHYPEAKIRLDANGCWSVDEALSMVRALRDRSIEIEYFEQPCASVEELVVLRARLAEAELLAKVAVDESIRKAADPLAVIRAGAADILVLKVSPLGGIGPLREIARVAKLPVVLSSALETSVGIARGLQAAAALENLELDCGLGTAALLAGDVTKDSLIPKNGRLEVADVTPEPALLDRWAASSERRDWWFKRLEAAVNVQPLEVQIHD
jgi:O-succinylbenzoate synthase